MRELKVVYDEVTRALKIVDYAHHEIHSGSHFFFSAHTQLDNGQTTLWLLTTPDTAKYIHMLFSMSGSAISKFEIYEDCTHNGTTPQTARNSNRNSDNAAGLTIHLGATGGADGTLIFQHKSGSSTGNARAGAGIRSDEEMILKRNTKYLVLFNSGTNSNLMNLTLSWYEHTTKLPLLG